MKRAFLLILSVLSAACASDYQSRLTTLDVTTGKPPSVAPMAKGENAVAVVDSISNSQYLEIRLDLYPPDTSILPRTRARGLCKNGEKSEWVRGSIWKADNYRISFPGQAFCNNGLELDLYVMVGKSQENLLLRISQNDLLRLQPWPRERRR